MCVCVCVFGGWDGYGFAGLRWKSVSLLARWVVGVFFPVVVVGVGMGLLC